jgi:hypothetical protein
MVKKWVIEFSKHTIDHKALKMKGSYAFSLRVGGILCPWISYTHGSLIRSMGIRFLIILKNNCNIPPPFKERGILMVATRYEDAHV